MSAKGTVFLEQASATSFLGIAKYLRLMEI
jgi:hypothetical protein